MFELSTLLSSLLCAIVLIWIKGIYDSWNVEFGDMLLPYGGKCTWDRCIEKAVPLPRKIFIQAELQKSSAQIEVVDPKPMKVEVSIVMVTVKNKRVTAVHSHTTAYAHQALFSLSLDFNGDGDLLEFHTKSIITLANQEALFQLSKHFGTRVHIFAKNIVLAILPNGQVFEYQNAY